MENCSGREQNLGGNKTKTQSGNPSFSYITADQSNMEQSAAEVYDGAFGTGLVDA